MHANDLLGTLGCHGEFDDRDRGGIRRQDGPGVTHHPVQTLKDLHFQVFVLRDGLDHHLAVTQQPEILAELEVATGPIGLLFRDFARRDGSIEGTLDAGLTLGEGLGVALDHDDVGAGARTDLGDSRAHQTTPDHANSFHSSLLFRRSDGAATAKSTSGPLVALEGPGSCGGEYDWLNQNARRRPYI